MVFKSRNILPPCGSEPSTLLILAAFLIPPTNLPHSGHVDPSTRQPFDLEAIYRGCKYLPRGIAQAMGLTGCVSGQQQQHNSGTGSCRSELQGPHSGQGAWVSGQQQQQQQQRAWGGSSGGGGVVTLHGLATGGRRASGGGGRAPASQRQQPPEGEPGERNSALAHVSLFTHPWTSWLFSPAYTCLTICCACCAHRQAPPASAPSSPPLGPPARLSSRPARPLQSQQAHMGRQMGLFPLLRRQGRA